MKQMRPRAAVLAGLLAALFLMGVVPARAAQDPPQTAVSQVGAEQLEGHWAYSTARMLIDRGILVPGPDGGYHPGDLVYRDDLVGWIMAAWGGEYTDPIETALQYGILEEEDLLSTEPAVTRSTTARISVCALTALFDETAQSANAYLAAQYLEDISACHACIGYVAESYAYGLMGGKRTGFFDGEDLMTRAEAWVVVARLIDPSLRCVPDFVTEGEQRVLLTADAAQRMLQINPNIVLLDVRNEEERLTGFLPGSICIPLAELKETGADALLQHKADPIIVYCQSGGRSAQAQALLEELGYSPVFDLGAIGNWSFDLEYPAS